MRLAERITIATLVVASFVCGARGARADTFDMKPHPPVADLEEILKRQPQGPSFDCRSIALTEVEKRICDDATLSRLDLKLNDAYAADTFESFDALGVVAREAWWLRVRDACATNACLRSLYRRRLGVLREENVANERRLAGRQSYYVPTHASRALVAELAKGSGGRCFGIDARIDPGDGSASLLAHTCDTCLPIDHFIIFHPEGRSYRMILRAESCYVSGIFSGFQDARTHGLQRIRRFSRDAMCEYHNDYYDYDGRRYDLVASIDSRGLAPHCEHTQLTVYTKT
jgi:hypothetical protein